MAILAFLASGFDGMKTYRPVSGSAFVLSVNWPMGMLDSGKRINVRK